MEHPRRVNGAIAALSIVVAAGFCTVTGAVVQSGEDADVEMSGISGDPEQPRRHYRLGDPAHLKPDKAGAIYDGISSALRFGYMRSGHPVAAVYQTWRRYNTAPYLSPAHGNHYLNNYANPTAKAYGAFEEAGKLPVGSIIAKDSFSVTNTGEILLGPLFVMEKMPDGFEQLSGDWKYIMVKPDGTLFGETNGPGSERVLYCIGCHGAVEHHDHLWFLPKDYRIRSD